MASVESFTLVDFSIPQRESPLVHPVSDTPPKPAEQEFFDPTTPEGEEVLQNPKTSISDLFAIMRQWIPHTQQNMTRLVQEVMRRGAHVDDKDGLTDMTLLHFACKSAAEGVGNVTLAAKLVDFLLEQGADVCARCRWTSMLPIHYAAFFDASEVIERLLLTSKCDINSICPEFDRGTALHIAAANLCYRAVQCLLEHNADMYIRDGLSRQPLDCVPSDETELTAVATAAGKEDLVVSIRESLQQAMKERSKTAETGVSKAAAALGTHHLRDFPLGTRVLVGGTKYGVVRFTGSVDFAEGDWVGVELEQGVGNHNGIVQGRQYFTCAPQHGVLAPLRKVVPATHQPKIALTAAELASPRRISRQSSTGSLPGASLKSRRQTSATSLPSGRGLRKYSADSTCSSTSRGGDASAVTYKVGDEVFIGGTKSGILRFIGATEFSPGIWYGVELDKAEGKNDGSVQGKRYFKCAPRHGLFTVVGKLSLRNRLNGAPSLPSSRESLAHSPGPSRQSSTKSLNPSAGGTTLSSSTLSLPTLSTLPTNEALPSSSHSSPGRSSFRSTTRSSRRRAATKPSGPAASSTSRQTQGSTSSVGSNEGLEASDIKLTVGRQVLVNHELGTVRFIGETKFADGLWLGVELRKPNGKNDGAVQGQRYFTCKPNHGLLVRPNKATFRGIDCSKLLLSD